jgi:hypothetical protein
VLRPRGVALAAVLALSLVAAGCGGGSHEDASAAVSATPREGKAVSSRGVDAGGDGRADVVLLDAGGRALLWQMNGASVAAQSELGTVGAQWQVVDAGGDYDGDGRTDLLWRHADGSVSVWLMEGAVRRATAFLGAVDGAWQIADGRGDYDGDGRSDILWRHSSGTVAIWRMVGTTVAGATFPATVPAEWTIVDGSGDYDGDGRSDVLWRHASGVTAIWRMVGGAIASTSFLPGVGPEWRLVDGSGDYDGDGRSDLLWRSVNEPVVAWYMGGPGTVTASAVLGRAGAEWRVLDASSDFDGDRRSDVLWQHADGLVLLWTVSGTARTGAVSVGRLGAEWRVAVGAGVKDGTIPGGGVTPPPPGTPPVLTIGTEPTVVVGRSLRWTFLFGWDQAVSGFEAADVAVVGGTPVSFGPVAGLSNVWRLQVDQALGGEEPAPRVSVAANRVTGASGQANASAVSATGGTQSVAGDYGSASPGTGDGVDGSSDGVGGQAGDGGSGAGPVTRPRAPTVTARVDGASLRLEWTHPPFDGAPLRSRTLWYQVLVRETPSAHPYPLGPALATTSPGFSIAVPRAPSQRTYLVRAYDGQDWGWSDSTEFDVNGAPFRYDPPTLDLLAQRIAGASVVGAGVQLTVQLAWRVSNRTQVRVGGFSVDDLSVEFGRVTALREVQPFPGAADNQVEYQVDIDLPEPPYPSWRPWLRVQEGRVTNPSNGHLNRSYVRTIPAEGSLSESYFDLNARTGLGPGGTAGNAVPSTFPPLPPQVTTDPTSPTFPGPPYLRWGGQPSALPNPPTFYQVLVRQGPGQPLYPIGARIPAVTLPSGYSDYSVLLPSASRVPTWSYRVRACNTQRPSAGAAFLTDGFTGCTDSREVDAYGRFLDRSTLALLAGAPTAGALDAQGAAARFFLPLAMVADRWGTLYVADSSNHTIRRVTSDGRVTTLAGAAGQPGSADGAGAAARFNRPGGIALGWDGTLYVSDSVNATIRRVTMQGVVTTIAGVAGARGAVDGTGAAARFSQPEGLAFGRDAEFRDVLYVADGPNRTVRRVTLDGVVSTFAGSAGLAGAADGTGAAARFGYPVGVAIGPYQNDVYVSDAESHTIRRITPQGVVSTVAGTAGQAGAVDGTRAATRFNGPRAIAAIADYAEGGDVLFVSDLGNHAVRRVAPSGATRTVVGRLGVSGVLAEPLPGGLVSPVALALFPLDGRLAIGTQNAVMIATPEDAELPWR